MNQEPLGQVLDATLSAFSVVGGLTAFWSGALAGLGLIRGLSADGLQHQVNMGLAIGGLYGAPSAIVLFFLRLANVV